VAAKPIGAGLVGGIGTDRIAEVGYRAIEIAVRLPREPAIVEGGGIIGREAQRLVVVRDGAVEVALVVPGDGARAQGLRDHRVAGAALADDARARCDHRVGGTRSGALADIGGAPLRNYRSRCGRRWVDHIERRQQVGP
jgi:hypothetical protein